MIKSFIRTACVAAVAAACFVLPAQAASKAEILRDANPVSYTHLTLPTICSV